MPRQPIFPNPQSKPSGFSPATRAGNLVFVSGQVAAGADGNLVGKGANWPVSLLRTEGNVVHANFAR